MSKPRLGDVLGLEALRNQRDARRLVGRLRGRSGERALERLPAAKARQLALALRHVAAAGLGGSIAVHSDACRQRDHLCQCAVLVLVPGASA